MGRYIYGWLECRELYPQPDEPLWQATIKLEHLLDRIKDYYGFYTLFGDGDSVWTAGDNVESFLSTFPPIAAGRGLPQDISAPVKAEYDQFDADPKPGERGFGKPPLTYDLITRTTHEKICWREVQETDRERYQDLISWYVSRYTASHLSFESYPKSSGELVFRIPVLTVMRPPASWLTWQELKQVDWEEVVDCPEEWNDTEGKIMKRKEIVENWDRCFKVMEVLADKYGDEGVRAVAWLDT